MRKLISLVMAGVLLAAAGCGSQPNANPHKAVYLLLDTSGTYAKQLEKTNAIINYLLGTLGSADSFAIARIDSGSFSEKDIIAKVTFDDRPSAANRQKRAFRQTVSEFFKGVQPSRHTDIHGGMLQASEYLNETGAGHRFILVFSDLEEDLVKGHVRDFVLPLENVQVVALNVTKLSSDIVDPREYLNRLDLWEKQVTQGGGRWRVMNDLDRLDKLLIEAKK